MKLQEVQISDYGPLSETIEFHDGVHVVHGPNESGKTLLVDALLLLLVAANEDDRVGQQPHGFVKLDEGDSVRRLEADETILDRYAAVYDMDMDRETFRDTFVIRSADSALSEEDEYYDRATDIVAESLVADIKRLREEVANRGRITTGDRLLWNRKSDGYIRDHHETAEKLHEAMTAFIQRADAEGVRSQEAELYRAQQARDRQAEVVEELERAKAASEFRANETDRDELAAKLDELAELPAADTLSNLESEVEDVLEATSERAVLDGQQQRARRLAVLATVATGIAVVAGLIVGGALSVLLGPSAVGMVLAVVAAFVVGVPPAALSVYYWYTHRAIDDDLASIAEAERAVLSQARKADIDIETIDELSDRIDALQRRRASLEEQASELHGSLQTALGIDTDGPSETLEQATEVLEARRAEVPLDVDRSYSATELEQAKEALKDAEERVETLEEQLEATRDEIQEYAAEASELPFDRYNLTPPPADVQSIDGLESVADRLAALVERIETDADNARAVMDVLAQVERTERSEVEELFFGSESEVSDRFARITDGRYAAVTYDESENQLRIRRASGLTLRPAQLSQSTFDQLYFAVRTAFAQELLDERTGFLLLDDAFLAADSDRLERQARILAELADSGWQVIYLTAKPAAQEVLTGVADAASTELSPVD